MGNQSKKKALRKATRKPRTGYVVAVKKTMNAKSSESFIFPTEKARDEFCDQISDLNLYFIKSLEKVTV